MRRTSMILTGWLAMGFVLSAVAAAVAAEPPFTGVVTGDNVYVRSGASKNHLTLTKLNTGDLVEVNKAVPGWYLIKPVKGIDSLISKKFVKLADDGVSGTVTGDRVNVREPNPDQKIATVQTQLSYGDKVAVTGSFNDDFYRIVPPEGVHHVISAQYVTEATAEDIAAAAAKEAAEAEAETDEGVVETVVATTGDAAEVVVDTTAAVAEGAVEVTVDAAEAVVSVVEGDAEETTGDKEPATADHTEVVTETDGIVITEGDAPTETMTEVQAETEIEVVEVEVVAAETETLPATQPAEATEPVVPIALDTTAPADQQLARLETIFSDESAKPLAEQNVAGLLAAYEALGKHEALADDHKQVIATRVALLNSRAELKRTIAQLTETKGEAEPPRDAAPAKQYTAVGKLLASTVYTGGRLPLLYRLTDPLSGLTIAYVDPGPDRAMARHLGKVVGIVGDSQYDQGLRLKIIAVQEIDALTAGR